MESWREDILRIISKIMSRKDSEMFKDAVDWEELGLTDYPEIIKKPMHLRLVKSNVENGVYKNAFEAAADMRLVFSNAMTYNDPSSKVYATAKAIAEYWETNWAMTAAGSEDEIGRPPSKESLVLFAEKCH